MKHKPVIVLLSILAVASLPVIADDDHDRARKLVESGTILPLEDLLAKARDHQPGRILEVELENEQGKPVYEIEILGPDGIVHELLFDAASGNLLKQEKEE